MKAVVWRWHSETNAQRHTTRTRPFYSNSNNNPANNLHLLLLTIVVLLSGFSSKTSCLACDSLPDNPTWADLTSRLEEAQQQVTISPSILVLCPFRIQGDVACPSVAAPTDSSIFRVFHPSLQLQCEGKPQNCVVDCPAIQFVIEQGGSLTLQNITIQNNLNTMVQVGPMASFTSIASVFQNGQQGAIQGQENSSIFIFQGSVVVGNTLTVSTNQRGAGVSTQGNLEIRDSVFANNVNEGNSGGAVAVGTTVYDGSAADERSNTNSAVAAPMLVITGTTFRSNRAPYAPAVFAEATLVEAQITFSDNRACDNVAVLSPDASCQGLYFLSSFLCVPFGKGCLEDDGSEQITEDNNCSFTGCILKLIYQTIMDLITDLVLGGLGSG